LLLLLLLRVEGGGMSDSLICVIGWLLWRRLNRAAVVMVDAVGGVGYGGGGGGCRLKGVEDELLVGDGGERGEGGEGCQGGGGGHWTGRLFKP